MLETLVGRGEHERIHVVHCSSNDVGGEQKVHVRRFVPTSQERMISFRRTMSGEPSDVLAKHRASAGRDSLSNAGEWVVTRT